MKITRDVPYGNLTTRAHLLDIMRPDTLETLPVVIHFHGGGWQMFGKYLPETEFLAHAGFCVVSANYRYASDNFFPAQLEDAQAVVRYIRTHAAELNISPNRIYAWGISAGAHIAALLGSDRQSALAGIACVCPPTDLDNAQDWALEYANGAFEFLLGARADTHPALAKAASPVWHVSNQTAPTLIIHGTADELVPIEQATALQAALEQAGVTNKLAMIPEGNHYINETHTPLIQHEILEFFQNNP